MRVPVILAAVTALAGTLALTACSAPADAAELKPGKYEIKTSVDGPSQLAAMASGQTQTRCMTQAQIDGMRSSLEAKLTAKGSCEAPKFERDGNTMRWTTQCKAGSQSFEQVAELTIEDETRFTSRVSAGGSKAMTLTNKGSRIGECDG